MLHLNVAWVHEDPNLSSHGLWWQIGCELSSNDPTVSMWPANFTPNAAIMGVILFCFRLVYIG
ncbi:hypothetical protein SGI37_20760, partial [Providencia rettgeri]